jgi:hypothetical protein
MKKNRYPKAREEAQALRELAVGLDREPLAPEEAMVRTQVYLTRAEHNFLQKEAYRRGEAMAAFLRRLVDEKMAPPEDAWTNNPMLQPIPDTPEWEGPEDASLNHDHYAYGAPKKYKKVRGKWVLKPEDEA